MNKRYIAAYIEVSNLSEQIAAIKFLAAEYHLPRVKPAKGCTYVIVLLNIRKIILTSSSDLLDRYKQHVLPNTYKDE